MQWTISDDAVLWTDDDDDDDGDDDADDDDGAGWEYEYKTTEELDEVARLVKLVEGTTVPSEEPKSK
jgi:hypothetical protein